MPKLTDEQKLENRRQRMIRDMTPKTPTGKLNFVADKFQEMIRAEAGAYQGRVAYYQKGQIYEVTIGNGWTVCVTCGVRKWWNRGMQAGHYLAGRNASVLLAAENCHCQCRQCNNWGSGEQQAYTTWMMHVYGQEEIDRLRRLKHTTKKYTVEELADLRIEFMDRTKKAVKLIENGS